MERDFYIDLFTEENYMMRRALMFPGVVPCRWMIWVVSMCPGPETFTKTQAYSFYEKSVRVIGKETFKGVDVNWSIDRKKVWASLYGL